MVTEMVKDCSEFPRIVDTLEETISGPEENIPSETQREINKE